MSDEQPFICPNCGSRHFGRDTGPDESGKVEAKPTVRCHDEFRKGCKWRGEWPKEEP